MERKPISHFIAGLIIAAVLVIYSLALNFMGLGQQRALVWVSYILLVLGILIFTNLYGKALHDNVTFGNLFGYGFKITGIVTLIVIAFLILIFLAFPEFKDKIMETARQSLENQGNLSDEQIDNAIDFINRNFLIITLGTTLFMYLLCGLIGSLIGAAITKKKPLNPLDQLSM